MSTDRSSTTNDSFCRTEHLYTNHFTCSLKNDIQLYQYDISVEELIVTNWTKCENRLRCANVVRKLTPNNQLEPNLFIWYDEQGYLYSTSYLEPRSMRSRDGQSQFHIHGLCDQWSTNDIMDYIEGKTKTYPYKAINCLECLLKNSLQGRIRIIKYKYYFTDEPATTLDNGFELGYGFIQSLHLVDHNLTLNIQTKSTIFYPNMSLLQFIHQQINSSQILTYKDYDELNFKLQKCIIISTGESNNGSDYEFNKFDDRRPANIQHETGQSLIDYYQNEKNIQLTELNYPCIEVYRRNDYTKKYYLPLEVCYIKPWQIYESSLVMQNDNTHIPTPEERYNYTRHVLDHCQYNSNLLCQAVGLHIDDDEMLEFNAGILPLPYIKTSLKYQAHIDVDNGQILLDERLQKPKSISTLAVTYFGRDFQGRKEVFDLFTDKLIDTMERYSLYERHEEHIVEPNFEQISQYFRSMSEQMCEFVVCIMHGQSEEELTELRNNIKKCGTILYGIMTQCAVYSEIYMDERMTNYCDNLIRKINFKNGGINTEVVLYSAFKDRNIDKDKLMFFGGAVLHPMNVTCQNPSIAAIVGSGNSSCSTTATRVSKQYPKEGNRSIHMIVGMAEMIIELLDYYRHENQYLPNKVIFYRDGINNEEFLEVLDYEIAAIRRAFFKIYGDKRNHPHLTFIIVNHRHHTRFFTYKRNLYRTDDASGERPKETDNMSIGCVIDTTIVHPYQHNFYLNSHNTDRGVNNPSLYDVILNENDFTLNELELLTYYLCFTDSRSSSSEATPSVVHQANKATINAQDLFDNSTNSTGSNRNKRMQSLQNTIPIDLDYEILQVHENLRNRPVFA